MGRSAVVRPPLPPLDGRIDRFDYTVSAAVEFLRSAWEELRDVRFEVGAMPMHTSDDGIPRWFIDREAKRIVLFRVPLERLDRMPRDDELQQKMLIEGAVFRASAEYLGRDPWDLGPDHYRP